MIDALGFWVSSQQGNMPLLPLYCSISNSLIPDHYPSSSAYLYYMQFNFYFHLIFSTIFLLKNNKSATSSEVSNRNKFFFQNGWKRSTYRLFWTLGILKIISWPPEFQLIWRGASKLFLHYKATVGINIGMDRRTYRD